MCSILTFRIVNHLFIQGERVEYLQISSEEDALVYVYIDEHWMSRDLVSSLDLYHQAPMRIRDVQPCSCRMNTAANVSRRLCVLCDQV
jgi:hypothetical protein